MYRAGGKSTTRFDPLLFIFDAAEEGPSGVKSNTDLSQIVSRRGVGVKLL